MRLSMDGLTPISEHGMKDWFRDNLKITNKLIGSYDDRNDEYNITLKDRVVGNTTKPTTVSFKESAKGWVSFKSFIPENANSCANDYYSFQDGQLYKHYIENQDRNTFYDNFMASSVTVILNDSPGSIKNFQTLNYEGSQGHMKTLKSYDTFDKTSFDGTFGANGEPNYTLTNATVAAKDTSGYNLQNLTAQTGWYVSNIQTDKEEGSIREFIEKEGKWFNYIKGREWL